MLFLDIKIEEKNFIFFYLLWNYKTYCLVFFCVLVKYLQLWSIVQCLRIKFTAFFGTRDKKKNRKSTPKSQSAINTCCTFLIAGSSPVVTQTDSLGREKLNNKSNEGKKCSWTLKKKQKTRMISQPTWWKKIKNNCD